jgi:hypothetical protein
MEEKFPGWLTGEFKRYLLLLELFKEVTAYEMNRPYERWYRAVEVFPTAAIDKILNDFEERPGLRSWLKEFEADAEQVASKGGDGVNTDRQEKAAERRDRKNDLEKLVENVERYRRHKRSPRQLLARLRLWEPAGSARRAGEWLSKRRKP